LTFDDGPDGKYTPQILNILKKYHVHATFFVIGEQVKEYPNMIKRMIKEGHVVANHTWDHPHLPKLSNAKVRQEMLRTNQIVKQITGKEMDLMRPPYGEVEGKVRLLQDMGFSVIEWDVDTLDWKKGRTPAQILRVIKKETRPGSIILEHCAGGPRRATVQALPKVIKYLKSKGYQFVTVDQMLGIPAYQ
jgi:peptidoglycan/xylan/chitin deacetylase (PgdA/CDA1 family)